MRIVGRQDVYIFGILPTGKEYRLLITPISYPKPKDEEETIQEAMTLHKEAYDAMSTDLREWEEDLKFAGGDQWPEAWAKMRNEDTGAIRPCLVIDRLSPHIKQVSNGIRIAPPSMIVRPVDGKADVKTAEIFTGLIRHIESMSMIGDQYSVVTETQVPCGVGYLRAYPYRVDPNDPSSTDICVQAVPDIFSVTLDPYAVDPYGQDASHWEITHDMPRSAFERRYPDVVSSGWTATKEMETTGWWTKKSIRLCEFMRFEDWPIGAKSGRGSQRIYKNDGKGSATERKMVWRLLCAAKVLEEKAYNIKFIPMVRIPGEIIRGSGMSDEGRKIRYRGMVHRSRDPQIRVNVTNSMQVEREALTPLPAPIGAEGQFVGHEDVWNTANKVSYGYREYKPITVGGQLIGAPQPPQGVSQQPGLITSIQQAAEDLRATTGQGPENLDEISSTSGVAFQERRRSGDTATYHFPAHVKGGSNVMGKILINMIQESIGPKQVLRILGEDGTADQIQHDGRMEQAHKAFMDQQGHLQHIYNLGVGVYDLVVDTGPSYATKRQEAAGGMKDIVQGNPALWQVGGDLLVKNLDWPGADEFSKRLRKTIDPKFLEDEDAVDPKQEEMKAKVQQSQQMMQAAQQELQQLDQAKEVLQAKAAAAKAEVAAQEKEIELQEMKAQMQGLQLQTMQGQMDEMKLGALMQGQEMIAGNIARQVIDQTARSTKRFMKMKSNPRDGSIDIQTVGRVKDPQTGLDLQIVARVMPMPDGSISGEQIKLAPDGTVVSRKSMRMIQNPDGSMSATVLGDE